MSVVVIADSMASSEFRAWDYPRRNPWYGAWDEYWQEYSGDPVIRRWGWVARSREISVSFDLRRTTLADVVAHSEHRPATAMAALMECAPGEEPSLSMEEMAPLREIIGEVLDTVLNEREKWIFDGLFVRRLSYRELAREMNLSLVHIDRLLKGDNRPGKEYVGMREKLIAQLLTYEEIREWLK